MFNDNVLVTLFKQNLELTKKGFEEVASATLPENLKIADPYNVVGTVQAHVSESFEKTVAASREVLATQMKLAGGLKSSLGASYFEQVVALQSKALNDLFSIQNLLIKSNK